MPRKKIPAKTHSNILIKSKRRCALCFGLHNNLEVKEGQLAHIDRNNENNLEENLAYLCLQHHNLYDTNYRQTANYTPGELIYYKNKLEEYVEKNLVLLDNSHQTSNNKVYNSHDYEMFLNIIEICLKTGNLNRLIYFQFGRVVPENYFCIDEENSILLADYFRILKHDVNYYFRDTELETLFNRFLHYLFLATDRISNSYYITQNYYLQLNNNFNKGMEAKEFDNYVQNMEIAFRKFQNRAIELGLIS